MMTKPKAPTCHIEISLRLMRYPPGIDNLYFYTYLIYSVLPTAAIGTTEKPTYRRQETPRHKSISFLGDFSSFVVEMTGLFYAVSTGFIAIAFFKEVGAV
jgi:hypothetical protein